MRRVRAHQLPLPVSLTEGVRLQEDFIHLQTENHQPSEPLVCTSADIERLHQHIRTLEREQLHHHLRIARGECLDWMAQASYWRRRATRHAAADQEAWVKGLLTLTHSDNWSQGQPATQLAHEITVVVHMLRERMGMQP
jgi:hypothetical protein